MTQWIYLAGGVTAVAVPVIAGVRWLIRAYLRELVPNGGQSMNDRVSRIESRLEMLIDHLITNK